MSTGPGVNLGKTAFVEEFLTTHRDANVEAVKEAWTAADHEGTISESLVNKMRHKLGLTGGKRRRKRSELGGEASAQARKPGRPANPVGRPRRNPEEHPVAARVRASTRNSHDENILDELEESIDELIQKIRELGDRPDVVKALRRARRILARGHDDEG